MTSEVVGYVTLNMGSPRLPLQDRKAAQAYVVYMIPTPHSARHVRDMKSMNVSVKASLNEGVDVDAMFGQFTLQRSAIFAPRNRFSTD